MAKKFRISTFSVMLIVVFGIFYTSCKKEEVEPEAKVATSIELVSGGNQTAVVETTLENPVEVLVKDQYGDGFAEVTVKFETTDGTVSAATGTTNAEGKATVTWTLGTTVGEQALTVTAFKADGTTALTGSPITVKATGEAPPLAVGDVAHGGIVFYLFEEGDDGYVAGELHGLVCAETDQSSAAEWGPYGTIGANGHNIGTGAQNTTKIVGANGGEAATLCSDLVIDGYDDWFLPSKGELNLMYVNLHEAGIGGFDGDSYYWSSTEESMTLAWLQYFKNGIQFTMDKGSGVNVRAVRAF